MEGRLLLTVTIVLSLLGILLLILAILGLIAFLRDFSRTRGNYYTQEDEGEREALDADAAVLQGRTGEPVRNKREWYI